MQRPRLASIQKSQKSEGKGDSKIDDKQNKSIDPENKNQKGEKTLQQNKQQNVQKNKDKEKDIMEQNYEEIPELLTIDKPRKPEISSQRKQDLKQKLQLEKESMIKVRQRQKINNLIFSFDRNVFRQTLPPIKPIAEGERTTVSEVHKLTNNSIFDDYQQTRRRFREEMSDQVRVFDKIKSTFGKSKLKIHDREDQQTESQKNKKVQEDEKIRKSKEKQEIKWLDTLPKTALDIYKMEQQNIYLKKDKGLNIFREARLAHQKKDSKQSFLEQTNFIQKSMADSFNITSIKIDSFKHISKFARLLAANKQESINHKKNQKLKKIKQTPEDYLNQYDMSYQMHNLDYRVLMNIASGRFTSNFFAKNLLQIQDAPVQKTDEKKDYSLSQKSQKQMQIPPREGYKHQEHQIQLNNMDDFYRDCMIKAPLLQSEQRTKKQYKKLYKQIQRQAKKKQLQLLSKIDQKDDNFEQQQITIDKLNHFRGQKHSYKEIKKIFQQNKKEKTKKDQFWLENFNKVLQLQIKTFDQMQRMKKESIFYEM